MTIADEVLLGVKRELSDSHLKGSLLFSVCVVLTPSPSLSCRIMNILQETGDDSHAYTHLKYNKGAFLCWAVSRCPLMNYVSLPKTSRTRGAHSDIDSIILNIIPGMIYLPSKVERYRTDEAVRCLIGLILF